jgi:S-DNA-T family DNA segregation ATPase FtsK/SpoIIIE
MASEPDPVTTRTALELASSGRGSDFQLTVVEGPDRNASLRIDSGRPRALVGQSPACELRLTDPSVSRRHLALDATEAGLRLTDLGSTNRITFGYAF